MLYYAAYVSLWRVFRLKMWFDETVETLLVTFQAIMSWFGSSLIMSQDKITNNFDEDLTTLDDSLFDKKTIFANRSSFIKFAVSKWNLLTVN